MNRSSIWTQPRPNGGDAISDDEEPYADDDRAAPEVAPQTRDPERESARGQVDDESVDDHD